MYTLLIISNLVQYVKMHESNIEVYPLSYFEAHPSELSFLDYQRLAHQTANYHDRTDNSDQYLLGHLESEITELLFQEEGRSAYFAPEIPGKPGYIYSASSAQTIEAARMGTAKETGDILWFIAELLTVRGLQLEDAATRLLDMEDIQLPKVQCGLTMNDFQHSLSGKNVQLRVRNSLLAYYPTRKSAAKLTDQEYDNFIHTSLSENPAAAFLHAWSGFSLAVDPTYKTTMPYYPENGHNIIDAAGLFIGIIAVLTASRMNLQLGDIVVANLGKNYERHKKGTQFTHAPDEI
jgi:hypothetical protein